MIYPLKMVIFHSFLYVYQRVFLGETFHRVGRWHLHQALLLTLLLRLTLHLHGELLGIESQRLAHGKLLGHVMENDWKHLGNSWRIWEHL